MGLCCHIALRPFCALHVTLPSHLVCFGDCTDHAESHRAVVPFRTPATTDVGPTWSGHAPLHPPAACSFSPLGPVTSGCFAFRVKTEDLRQVHICVGSETEAPAAPQPLHHCRHLQVCSPTCRASISPFLSSTCTHHPVPCSAWAQDARGPHPTPAPWSSPSSEGQETTPGSHTHVGFHDRTSTSWVGVCGRCLGRDTRGPSGAASGPHLDKGGAWCRRVFEAIQLHASAVCTL